jgi:hypothetical protein
LLRDREQRAEYRQNNRGHNWSNLLHDTLLRIGVAQWQNIISLVTGWKVTQVEHGFQNDRLGNLTFEESVGTSAIRYWAFSCEIRS